MITRNRQHNKERFKVWQISSDPYFIDFAGRTRRINSITVEVRVDDGTLWQIYGSSVGIFSNEGIIWRRDWGFGTNYKNWSDLIDALKALEIYDDVCDVAFGDRNNLEDDETR